MDCSNSNISEETEQSDKYQVTNECAAFDFAIYTVAMGLLCLFGLVGNTISFTVLWKDSSKTGATSFILRALAVADSLVLLAAIPLYVFPFVYPFLGKLESYYELYPNIMPYLWPIYLIPYTATILLTVLVSLNRYFAVCRPLRSSRMRGLPQVTKYVLFITMFSVLYNIPRFFEYEKKMHCDGPNKTKEVYDVSDFGNNAVYRIIYANVLYFIIMHGGPLICLAFLNVKLIVALKQRQQKRADMGKGGYQQDITLVLVVVIFAFISCQTPTFVDHILWTFLDDSLRSCGNWHYYYTAVGDLLAIVNSSINFVIYVLTSRKFRQGLLVACHLSQETDGAGSPEAQTRLTHAHHRSPRQEKAPLMNQAAVNSHVINNNCAHDNSPAGHTADAQPMLPVTAVTDQEEET